jgi:hypothetical protein
VLTTDAPPMNEFIDAKSGILVPYGRQEARHLGVNYYVDENGFERALYRVFNLHLPEKTAIGSNARQISNCINAQFPTGLNLATLKALGKGE